MLDLQPIGLEASGGSTPLRIHIAGGPGGGASDVFVFGKLYAMSHVRADRWYKLGRTILYGRLEDEAPYKSVRRLVEYEDYALRLLRDVGIPTATPLGIVEITPCTGIPAAHRASSTAVSRSASPTSTTTSSTRAS